MSVNITIHQGNANQNHSETPLHPTVIKAMAEKIITIVGEDVEKLEPLHTDGKNMRWYSHFGKQSSSSSKSYT